MLARFPSSVLATAGAAGVLPLLVGAAGAPLDLPPGMPPWLTILLMLAGPAVPLVLATGGKMAAAWLRARGEAARDEGKRLLSDGDPANDGTGQRLVVDGAGMIAAAAVLEAASSALPKLPGADGGAR